MITYVCDRCKDYSEKPLCLRAVRLYEFRIDGSRDIESEDAVVNKEVHLCLSCIKSIVSNMEGMNYATSVDHKTKKLT